MGNQSAPISHYDGPVLHRLVNRVIAMSLVGMWSLPQNHKLLFKVSIDEREQSDGREEDVGHERIDNFRETLGDTTLPNSIRARSFMTRKEKTAYMRPTATWRTLSLATKSASFVLANIIGHCNITRGSSPIKSLHTDFTRLMTDGAESRSPNELISECVDEGGMVVVQKQELLCSQKRATCWFVDFNTVDSV